MECDCGLKFCHFINNSTFLGAEREVEVNNKVSKHLMRGNDFIKLYNSDSTAVDKPSRTLVRPPKVLGDDLQDGKNENTSRSRGGGRSPISNGPSEAEEVLKRLQGTNMF